ncbi:hypothetical protein AB670_00034 [Chryseobacterium sp. MOF25P]|uniref:hypothetical protein n=1 Tax=unclassified Chryseobacterium TaxID=2593645 RepID=UPI0008055398|nr:MULTISPECIES: hypothetical protein [unclassified Chryseobacterium]OBW43505.1 hypothetical protein AB670_00034 [Chryseobacterium sp. MOF25P]OBW46721.1 hypothetical protein AB671_01217 [Chryseobacterium sp. BGARF1]
MESKELRIGNFVSTSIDGTVIYIVEEIKMHGLFLSNQRSITDIGEVQYHNIHPIPLTEEWLIKFGFKNINLKYHGNVELIGLYLENIDSHLTFDKNEWRLEQNEDWRDGGNHHDLPNIEYVHQLQNLYFSLTGKELTLKENK